MRVGVLCLGGLVVLFGSTQLGAQTSDGALGFVSGRGGINVQAVPDGVSGTAVGAGASLGAFITSKWTVEFEAWIPGEIENPGVRTRTLLFSGSAVRFFDDERRGPYILIGLTAARIEFGPSQRRRSDIASGVQLGAGSAFHVGEQTMVAPEVRVNVMDGGVFLIRPNVAFVHTFP